MRKPTPLVLAYLASTACAVGTEVVQRPEAPPLRGDVPAIGKRLSLDLEDGGAPLELRGVTGRVTVVCVLGADGAPVVTACSDAERRWQDRIAVVGLSTADLDPATVPFRVYADPEGKELKESLELGPESRVVLVDNLGRVAELVPAAEVGGLGDRIEPLVF